jgi:hypothetical protein
MLTAVKITLQGKMDHSINMRIFWLVSLVAVAGGCTPKSIPQTQSPASAVSKAGVLDETKVLAIARQAVATNDTWVDRAEFEYPERQPDGSWSVRVWRIPKVHGGHRVIYIDEKGKVTDYIRGL